MNMQSNAKEIEVAKMKRFALLVLAIAFVLYMFGLYLNYGPLKAFGEAAMVGGIADWFAVVALFKHPMGIPIPHTALIPTNKDSIGDNLGSFVSEEFLVKKNLELKVTAFNPGLKVAQWMANPKNAIIVANLVTEHLIPSVLKSIDDVEIQHFVQNQFQKRVQKINFSEWIAQGLEGLSQSEKQQQLVTNLIQTLLVELQNNKEVIEEKVKKSTPFLTFGLADKKITAGIFNGLYEFLEEASYPESKVRAKIDLYLQGFIQDLKTLPELQEKVNEMVLGITQKEEVQLYLAGIWSEIKTSIMHDIEKEGDSSIRSSIVGLIQQFGENLATDQLMIEKINHFVKNDVLEVLIKNKQVIGELIASTVKSWDADEVSEKLELQVGKDLQFIRINGTVVGGLVGLLIYYLSTLFT